MFISTAYAQAASAPSAGANGALVAFVNSPFPMMVAVLAIFWFLVLRPQQRRLKEHRAMIAAVKRGDNVVTGGGLVGKVTKVADDEIEVELGPNLRVRAVRGTLSEVRPLAKPVAANDAKA